MHKEKGQAFFSALIVLAIIWIGMNRTLESVLSVIVMAIIYYGVYYATRDKSLDTDDHPDYTQSYDVDEEHNDFTKVGSGFPVRPRPACQCGKPVDSSK